MRILCATVGTRGDVQPFVALALALSEAGHEVTLATHQFACTLCDLGDVQYAPLNPRTRSIVPFEFFSDTLGAKQEDVRSHLAEALRHGRQALLEEIPHADLVIGHLGLVGREEAELLGKPYLSVHLESDAIPRKAPSTSPAVRDAGLPLPDRTPGRPPSWALLISSSSLEERSEAWEPLVEITGFMYLKTPEDWTPPEPLVRFLARYPNPAFVTFGSMLHSAARADAILAEIQQAARCFQGGVVVLIPGIHARGRRLLDEVLAIEGIPYDWLLPRVSVVVHHFGFGTNAEVLRAGRPSVPIPHFEDQHARAARFHALGLTVRPLQWSEFTGQQLANAMRTATEDVQLQHRTAELAARIAAEGNGTQRAIRFIHEIFGEPACP